MHLGKVHLLGHSRGGAVIAQVAENHPELVRTLILEDGAIQMPVEETAESKQEIEFTKRTIGNLRDGLKAGDTERTIATFVDALNGPGGWERTPAPVRQILSDNIYTAIADSGDRPNITGDDVRKFTFPVLAITGENSPQAFEFFYNEMRKCAKLDPTVVIPKAGHIMHRQNAEAFNAAVLAFVQTH
jgi:esterase